MSELDAKQQAALEAMRATFASADGTGMPMNDVTYGRYLRARNYNLAKATKMLQETIDWRKKFEIPKLMTDFKDTIALENSTGKMYVRGFDKEGRPLIYMKPVNENTKDHKGNIKHLVYSMERAVACMDAKGQGNTKLSLVIDYGGYTSSHAPPMKTATETLSILQNHYPERLQCAYCIRAPFVFYAFFKMVSPFIDSVTKKKISMIKNAELGTPGCPLSKEIDAEVLEASVGGLDKRPFNSAKYLAGPYDRDFAYILDNEGVAVAAAVAVPIEEAVGSMTLKESAAGAKHSNVHDIYGTDEEEAQEDAALAKAASAPAEAEAEAATEAETPADEAVDEETLLAQMQEMQAEIDAAAETADTTEANTEVNTDAGSESPVQQDA